MKLSQLLIYRSMLLDHKPSGADQILHQHIRPLLQFVADHEMQFPQQRHALEQALARAEAELRTFDGTVAQMIQHIDDLIARRHPEYLARSHSVYNQSMCNDTAEWILQRRTNLAEGVAQWVQAQVASHSDWTSPGLIIRPALEPWIRHLVGLDPLYLADTSRDLLIPAMERFTPQYQRRLRPYVLTETEHGVDSDLPSGQMGYVLAYNIFPYKTFELVKLYLKEIWRVMAPGAVLQFTFNDCDRPGGVDLVERNFVCYQPGSMMIDAVTALGFELVDRHELDAATTWLDFKKPGERRSLRGGQTLALMIDKSQKPQ